MAKKRKAVKETFTRFDSVEHLRSEADMAAYLRACLAEAPEDAGFIAAAIGDIARARGLTQLAKDTGLAREALYRSLSKDGNPSLDTILRVLGALGLQLSAKAA
jgi:probable addiction module antidote protein